MGQKYSVAVVLDGDDADGTPRAVMAGSSLRGTVVMTVHHRMKPDKINISLIGMEHSAVSKAGRSIRQEHVTLEGRISIPTGANQQEHRKGTYKFPFAFELPGSLASSLRFPSQSKSYSAKIEYCLSISMGKDRMTKIVPVVSAPLPNVPIPYMVKPTTHRLKSCGLIDHGVVSIGASVANSQVGRGESLVISIVSKNNTSARIERVRVKLVEVIEYRANNDLQTSACHQQKHEMTLEKYKDVSLPNIDKRRKSWREAKRSARSYDEKAAHRAIEEELLSSEENRFLLKVPTTARDSFVGKLITVMHYVEVAFLTKHAIRLSETPMVKIPVSIGTPPLVQPNAAAFPNCEMSPSTPTVQPSAPVEEEYIINPGDPGLHILECDVPFVEAVVVGRDDGSDSSGDGTPRPSAPSETFILQRGSVFVDDNIAIEANRSSDSLSLGYQAMPSWNRLLYELDSSSSETEVITAMLGSQDWVDFFNELMPREIGRIIQWVQADHQISVASLLFAASRFTCAHCAAAVKCTSEHLRPSMVENLVPFCVDIKTNYEEIRAVLNGWEMQLTARTFEKALRMG